MPVRAKDSEPDQPPHLWTVAEANRRIVDLAELLPRLKGWVLRLGEVHEEMKRLAGFWGSDLEAPDHADRDLKVRLDSEWRNLTRRLEEAVGSLKNEGIEIKDLESGTLDFYGRVDDEVVFFCWQSGEPTVAFYHPVSGSYRDRRPIPEAARSTSPPAPPG